MTGKRRRRRKQLLDDFKEKRGYWKCKAEALDRILLITRFERACVPVVRQTEQGMPTFLSSLLKII